jgi:predicted metal-dependent hydrolase
MRIATMWLIHLTFVLETSIWTLISLAMDPTARRQPRLVLRSLRRLQGSPFASPRLVRQLLQYTRRGFHPNDRDTTELVAEWRSRLFGSEGELREVLAS